MVKLGSKIKEYRKRVNLSQEQLGNKLGVSLKVVSKWENDNSLPDIETFYKLSKILDFSMDQIMNENNNDLSNQKYIDILDIDGQKTGNVATYDEIHKKGLWHKEVAVWIGNKNGKYLMQRRSSSKKLNPSKWAITAGHVYAGENDINALTRIIEKELNITPSRYNFRYLITDKQKNEGVRYRYYKTKISQQQENDVINKYFGNTYILRLNIPSNKISYNEKEIEEIKWMSIAQIKKLVKNNKSIFNDSNFNEDLIEKLEIDLLDVIDENNNLTGHVEEKYEVHEKGLWHREALVFIGNNKKQLLCYKRVQTTKINPGLIVPFFGGHVLTNEDYDNAAIRELKEETGLDLKNSDIKFLIQAKQEGKGKMGTINRRFTNYYFCNSNKKLEQFTFPKSEIDGAFWQDFEIIKNFVFTNGSYKSLEHEPMSELFDLVEKELDKIYN